MDVDFARPFLGPKVQPGTTISARPALRASRAFEVIDVSRPNDGLGLDPDEGGEG